MLFQATVAAFAASEGYAYPRVVEIPKVCHISYFYCGSASEKKKGAMDLKIGEMHILTSKSMHRYFLKRMKLKLCVELGHQILLIEKVFHVLLWQQWRFKWLQIYI